VRSARRIHRLRARLGQQQDRRRFPLFSAALLRADRELAPEGRFSDWDVRSAAAYRALLAWIGRSEVRQRIEDACLRERDPVAVSLLSIAEQVIAALAYRAYRHG
jgi:hypothetical protein